MRREKISPRSASLCAIRSTTDRIALVILCRARSEAGADRRSPPPSTTGRKSSRLIAPRQATCRRARVVLLTSACNSAQQIEDVKLHAGMAQKMSEIPEPLGIFQANCFARGGDGPELALFA